MKLIKSLILKIRRWINSHLKTVIIVSGVVLLIIIVDNICFSNAIRKADYYYNNREYYDAKKEIQFFPLHFNNKIYKKIHVSRYMVTDYIMYSSMIGYNPTDEDYKQGLQYLIWGYRDCIDYINDGSKLEKNLAEEMKKIYYEEINSIISLTNEEIMGIYNLDGDNMDNKISELYNERRGNTDNPLKIVLTSCSNEGASGTVTNQVVNNITYIKVKVVFKDSAGQVIDTDWTYAVSSEGLSYNESKKWDVHVVKDYSISSCSASIIDYNN